MKLINTARALDDQNFRWRVAAAQLNTAAAKVGATGNDYNFAIRTLMDPQKVDPSMLGFVSVDSAVSDAVVVNAEGTVSTDAVLDSDILRVVQARWSAVATKYPTNPLTAA